MKTENLITTYKDRLEAKLDEHFPKGKSKARGLGLVMLAESVLIIREVIRAFGSCTKCFGKGYGTQTMRVHEAADFEGDRSREYPANPIVYCDCERGRQLRQLLEREDEPTINV